MAFWRAATISSHVAGAARTGEAGAFAWGYLRLFSGTTIYEFISGTGALEPGTVWFDWLPHGVRRGTGGPGRGAAGGRGAAIGRARRRARRVACDVVARHAVGILPRGRPARPSRRTSSGMRSAWLRPAVLVMSRGLAWWLESSQRRRWIGWRRRWAMVAAWLWPVSFYCGYFEFIEQTGGRSHLTFRTAAVEPKLQAFRLIAAEHRNARSGPRSFVANGGIIGRSRIWPRPRRRRRGIDRQEWIAEAAVA